jgi:hypothetical protein
MSRHYLEVTFRQGKPFAAYLYLPRRPGDQSVRVEAHGPAFLVDWTVDGRPMGVEMPTIPGVTLEGLNQVLTRLQVEAVTAEELAPVVAA